MELSVSYWAIVVSGVAALALGAVWYGPLFGKQWMAIMGMTQADMEAAQKDKVAMYRSYGLMFLGALVMAFVLARGIAFGNAYLGADDLGTSFITAFWFWAGFIAPTTLGPVLWEKKPWTLWFINAGYYLVLLLIMTAIITSW